MCGRFAQFSNPQELMEDWLGRWDPSVSLPKLDPSWNVAPSKAAWVAADGGDGPAPRLMAWGFRPAWARDGMPTPINARAETAPAKGYFKGAWKGSRCIVPVDSYYEWQVREDGSKAPVSIGLVCGRPMLLAGLHAAPAAEGSAPTFAIVTTKARPEIEHIHGRMPLALAPEEAREWLDPGAGPDRVEAAAASPDVRELAWHAVSTRVNNPRNDGEELLRAADG